MVVLYEHTIAKVLTVVVAASASHSILLQRTQARYGLARIDDLGAGTFHSLNVRRRRCRNAAEVLHEVNGGALSLQHGGCRAADPKDDAASLHGCAIGQSDFHVEVGIHAMEHRSSDLAAG